MTKIADTITELIGNTPLLRVNNYAAAEKLGCAPLAKLEYFNQPFNVDNELQLVDDIYMDKPLGVISLSSDLEGVDAEMLFESRGRKQLKKGNQMAPNFETQELFNIPALTASV